MQIRDNSHYRKAILAKSECLPLCEPEDTLGQTKGRGCDRIRQGILYCRAISALGEGRFSVILFVKKQHERKYETVKSTSKILLCLLLCLLSLCALCACNEEGGTEDTTATLGQLDALWDTATYKEDAEIGKGSKTVTVDVEAKGHTVTLTVKTDAANLGQALYDLELINDAGFFDVANGMKADWNADQAYWAFYIGDTMASHGVGDAKIEGGEHYRLVYTK